MIKLPGSRTPTIKNRSSKQNYLLTRAGIKFMNAWHKSLGIPVYVAPKKTKKDVKRTAAK